MVYPDYLKKEDFLRVKLTRLNLNNTRKINFKNTN